MTRTCGDDYPERRHVLRIHLRALLDEALAGRQHFQRVSFDPLFFKTLNRPTASRQGVLHLGKIPYLNGGLFQAQTSQVRALAGQL